MSTCSYTWEELDREIGEYVEKKCQKETWEDSDKFCIFHDPSPEKDVDLFKEKLEEQMESKIGRHIFLGYYFPENWDFSGKEFKIDAYFWKATFQGTVDFEGATFQRHVSFRGATFQDTDFREATFQDTADFREATFQGAADFREATFRDTAYFGEVTFRDAADFGEAIFQDAHFGGAIFQNTAYFGGATFQNTAYFNGATFQDTAHFGGAIFQNTAHFREATFQDAYFGGAIFQDTADFREATFQDTADFREATFQDTAHFREATFYKKVELAPENNEKIDLGYTEFLSKSYINADLSKTLFHRASIENVAFIDCKWPDNYEIYEEKNMKDEDINLTFKELETIYRDLKQNTQNHGDYDTAGELYYREMEMKRKGASKKKKRLWLELYHILAGYGERPKNTAVVSGSVIFFFAFLYGITDCLQYSVKNPCLYQEIIDVVYFSFVTFTTLGLGDITPLTTLGKVLICLEAVIGAFMIAVFVVVFVRKMAR